MNIIISMKDLSRIGGSISTVMHFADTFKELGFSVKIITSFGGRFQYNMINKKEEILDFYNCKNLKFTDFIWDSYTFKSNDVVFSKGFNIKNIKNNKTISWVIAKHDLFNATLNWTNSHTTKNKLRNDLTVIVPPHDYSIFRNNISENKKYDVVSILRANDYVDKGIPLYAETIKKLNCKSLLITTSPNKKYLDIIKSFNVPFVVNQSREQIAKILGQSKTFFFPSYNESCPLVIYEALNSGCNIVSRDVGATVEQLNGIGHIFTDDTQCINLLKQSLEEKHNESKTIQRGLYFDKINWIDKIYKELKCLM